MTPREAAAQVREWADRLEQLPPDMDVRPISPPTVHVSSLPSDVAYEWYGARYRNIVGTPYRMRRATINGIAVVDSVPIAAEPGGVA